MYEITKIAVDEYQKNADGSRTCVKNSDITTKTGQLEHNLQEGWHVPGTRHRGSS